MSLDVIIRNGTVIDGTGAPRYQADIAIAHGRIIEVGKVRDGADRVIDGSGLIVAPGFIDPHTPTTRRSAGIRSLPAPHGTGSLPS